MNISAVKRDENGSAVQYKLDNGKVIDREQAVSMAEAGKLSGYNVATAKDGTKSIRSNRDNDPSNNIDNLPTF